MRSLINMRHVGAAPIKYELSSQLMHKYDDAPNDTKLIIMKARCSFFD